MGRSDGRRLAAARPALANRISRRNVDNRSRSHADSRRPRTRARTKATTTGPTSADPAYRQTQGPARHEPSFVERCGVRNPELGQTPSNEDFSVRSSIPCETPAPPQAAVGRGKGQSRSRAYLGDERAVCLRWQSLLVAGGRRQPGAGRRDHRPRVTTTCLAAEEWFVAYSVRAGTSADQREADGGSRKWCRSVLGGSSGWSRLAIPIPRFPVSSIFPSVPSRCFASASSRSSASPPGVELVHVALEHHVIDRPAPES